MGLGIAELVVLAVVIGLPLAALGVVVLLVTRKER